MDTATQDKARTMSFALVPADRLRASEALQRWVFPLLEKACSYSDGRFEPETVLASCAGLNPRWHPQLWTAGYLRQGDQPATIEAVAVTAITTYASGMRVLEVILVGGENAKGWMTFENKFAEWAAREGCSKIQMIGRKGWAKTLSGAWREAARMFERDVPELDAAEGGGDGR